MLKTFNFIKGRRKFFPILFLSLASWGSFSSVAAQTLVAIRGKVIDEQRNEAIIGANILIKDAKANTGIVTNLEGEFELKVPTLPATIVISYIGYKTQEI
ncbi:MAG: carboxypeptidase-like regulatory domain-containing protein, partial [Tannerella sp.]|nr:carboxypeptidase-like regulatory domain-containing protein [Tannerella sp.]